MGKKLLMLATTVAISATQMNCFSSSLEGIHRHQRKLPDRFEPRKKKSKKARRSHG